MGVNKTHKLHLFHLPAGAAICVPRYMANVGKGPGASFLKPTCLLGHLLQKLPSALGWSATIPCPGPSQPSSRALSGPMLVLVLLQGACSFCPTFQHRFLFFFFFSLFDETCPSTPWEVSQIARLTSKMQVFPLISVAFFNQRVHEFLSVINEVGVLLTLS